jgi:hypothetical protein
MMKLSKLEDPHIMVRLHLKNGDVNGNWWVKKLKEWFAGI